MVRLNNIDITQYVDKQSIVTNDTLDESLASGAFVIPFVSNTDIFNGDQPIPRFTTVDIDGLLYVVAEDEVKLVRKGTNKLYSHQVTLIEPTKILQKRVLPDLTVTQPQGDVSEYIFTVNRIDESQFTDGGYEVDNTQVTIPLLQTSPSQDTSIIDNRTLKTTEPYEINLRYVIENRQKNNNGFLGAPVNDPDTEIQLEVYYGTTKIGQKNIFIKGVPFNLFDLADPIVHLGGFKVDYDPSVINQTITVKVNTIGDFTSQLEDRLYIKEFSVTISQPETIDDKIYLDQVVDKCLQFHPEFTLSEDSRARLSQIKSPEFTFQRYTLYDALREVANFATAIVYLGEDDFTTIHFYFYDDDVQIPLDFVDETQQELLDGYADGLEINAPNVIRDDNPVNAITEPSENGWLTVRGASDERGEQIIDSNTAVNLELPIYKPIQVLVKGLEFDMKDELDQTVTFANTEIWDITNYVIEQERYNTFPSEANLNNRGAEKNKANTIYYRQGDNRIYGLGFIGTLPPGWNQPKPPNYAIWEAIMNKAAEENPTYTFTNDYLVDLNTENIHNLQFKVKHIPYSDVRLTIYKNDNREKNIMYFNEQASLNDMELLGKIAQENADRTGNRTVRLEGITGNDRFLLGSKIGDKTLVNYTISRSPTVNKFVAEYAVGYSNISDYVGIDSRYRQYEIPQDTIVNRRDKLTQFFRIKVSNTQPAVFLPDFLDTVTNDFTNSVYGNFLTTPAGSRPTYAKITIDEDKVVESTIDAYRMGRTLGLAFDMLDNYSAGITKKERQIYDGTSNIDIKTQEDARYTDLIGRFTSAEIEFYDGTGTVNIATSDNYPDNATSPTNKYFDYNYTVNKDARERWGFVFETIFQSDEISAEKVKVYDGFVKYNRLATEITPNTVEIRFLDKGYLPDKHLDIRRTILGTGTITVDDRALKIQASATIDGLYEGLILTINEEPILAIQTDDYDAGVQVTKYLYPVSFEENDFSLGLTEQIDVAFTATGFITTYKDDTASETVSVAFTATGQAQEYFTGETSETVTTTFTAVGNIYIDETGTATQTVTTNFAASGTAQEALTRAASETITAAFTAVGNAFIDEVRGTSETISANFTAVGNENIEQSGETTSTVSLAFTAVGNENIEQSGSTSGTVGFNPTATGGVTTLYNLRGYATATAVNIVVDFDDVPAFGYTLQTFTQTIGTKSSGTDVTVTAPSSYTLNGITYTFVDWRVDETSQTSTNRIFTTTIDQQKTLRLRYIAFGV
jgi:hypothetical protein